MSSSSSSNDKWTPVFDSNKQDYYYWNKATNETSWKIPVLLDISELSPSDPYFSSSSYSSWYYAQNKDQLKLNAPGIGSISETGEVAATFNVKTGRFQTGSKTDLYTPDPTFANTAKAVRQMNMFFDYNSYQEQRGSELQQEINSGKEKKSFTKKEIARFKAKRQDKKRQRLLREYRDDMELP